ncbi:MAG TPA: amidohydrolase family protein [Actinomycetota bacterium]
MVTAAGEAPADVLVGGGTVLAVGRDVARDAGAAATIDAAGLLVFPGMVDTHVHLMDPGATEREDFPTGTAAAAARGITTIVEHTHARPVRTPAELREKLAALRGRSNVDVGLAAHAWPDRLDRIEATWRAGVTFFKIFTCTTHGVPGLEGDDLERALRAIASCGGACLVHCEDEARTAEAEARLRAAGRDDPGVLTEWRSREAELEAVGRVARLAAATGARVTIAHVSSPEVAAVVEEGRRRGADLAAEACPQYLELAEDEVLEHGAFRKFTPPARSRSDAERAEMWRLLRDGVLTHVATDHAPSTREQKLAGGMWDAPFGLPGLDTTTRVLLDAVARGSLRAADVARRYAEEPARRYGLWPRKGAVRPGADADLALVDPDATVTITDDGVISKAGWTPYAGRTTRGDVVRTFLRGEEVAVGGVPRDDRSGRFLPGPGADRPPEEDELPG